MKNKIVTAVFAAVLCVSMTGCADKTNTAADSEVSLESSKSTIEAEADAEATKKEETEVSESDTSEGDMVSSDEGASADNSTENEYVGDAYAGDFSDWREAYSSYLNDLPEDDMSSDYTYSLIYVDEDDIPELVCNSGVEAAGCQILTFKDGKVDVLQTSRLYFTYAEKNNIICNSEGHMGYYYDLFFGINDGKWVSLGSGGYGVDDNSSEESFDEEGNPIYAYWEWNSKELSSADEYDAKLKEMTNGVTLSEPSAYYDLEDIKSLLETGSVESGSHSYEIVKEDTTWSDAQASCLKKKGYLATITSKDELEKIEKLIESDGKRCSVYLVGGKYVDYEYCWLENGNESEKRRMPFNVYYPDIWLDGEPSYSGKTEDGEEIKEDVLAIMYISSKGRYCLVDVPDDILSAAPSYKGNMGYICESDQ